LILDPLNPRYPRFISISDVVFLRLLGGRCARKRIADTGKKVNSLRPGYGLPLEISETTAKGNYDDERV